ncbi:MAG: ATP-binding cassette domain-containing protein [Candidatus Aminicenantales bacterium]
MNGTPAILAENLVKRYPVVRGFRELILKPFDRRTVTALDGVDLEVGRGRVFCLLGPNGAGKTTLIKILGTLVLPDGGRAAVDGHDVALEPGPAKTSVGYAVGDERSFYWRLTGRQNLEFFAALYGLRGAARDRKVGELMQFAGLDGAADLRVHSDSTGMRQMLSFARALLADAAILLVDEPTRSLDPQAADCADDIAVISRGRIRLRGPAAKLAAGGRASLRQAYEQAVDDSEVGP